MRNTRDVLLMLWDQAASAEYVLAAIQDERPRTVDAIANATYRSLIRLHIYFDRVRHR